MGMKIYSLLVGTILAITMFVVPVHASSTDNTLAKLGQGSTKVDYVSEAKEAVERYINASKQQDPGEMAKWAIDTRFRSTEEQINEYSSILRDNPFSSTELSSIIDNGNNTLTANITLTRNDNGEKNNVSIPVINLDGDWKLYITGVETMSSDVKRDINKLNKFHAKNNVVTPFNQEPGSHAYVNFSLMKPNCNFIYCNKTAYSSTFDMDFSTVYIVGVQYSRSDEVTYQIVKYGIISDDVYGANTFRGKYTSDVPFEGWISTVTRRDNVKLKVVNVSSDTGASGYVNVYNLPYNGQG
ncbi:hypothetical protein [Paenibacillus sp. B1-33]|uniref:hypothetical protein n=1 Tax=unclassified Paenibacillus TaxID=185978 RepID=UPI003D2D4FDA